MLRHSLTFNPLVPALRRPPRPSLLSANAVASSSRHWGAARPSSARYGYASYSYIGKGKAKAQWHEEGDQVPLPQLPLSLRLGRSGPFGRVPSSSLVNEERFHARFAASSMGAVRSFHATSRREALPLVPALGALLKGTSLLTLVTGVSRVLLSFFPIGTLAMFRMGRGVSWLSKDKRVPKASPEAEEFWKMWCEDERGVLLSPADAASLVEAPETPQGDLISPDGRIAYIIPMREKMREKWRDKHPEKPDGDEDEAAHTQWAKVMARRIRQSYFFLPPLPPVSVRFYNELSTAQQAQVDALRRYWVSLRMFKDRLRMMRWLVSLLFFMPVLLLLGVWATALERVPLTGRWRLILLTADEEDHVARSLEGANWFKSVFRLLTTADQPAPPVVPLNDWRWQWVQSTLRRLEAGVLTAVEHVDGGELGRPLDVDIEDLWPPPSKYPLRPRVRASARLHAALPGGDKDTGAEHMELGPPYNVMLMDAPDKNAFSYGFGGKGAGGIVIFTGLLDDILAHNGPPEDPAPEPAPPKRGFFESLFSSAPRPRATKPPEPTEVQTLHLAMVLAHEMGHLLLSHHLETLSHQQVWWPSVLGLQIDILRAMIWPFTIFFGPAVNDALASLGRTTAEEMTERFGHVGFDRRHEFEADFTGLRILAHAGFDPRLAVDHFANSLASLDEIGREENSLLNMIKLWSWAGHPSATERSDAMRGELDRWETYDEAERERVRRERRERAA